MRSGKGRSLAIAITAMTVASFCFSTSARAGGPFHHTIPRETLAMDYRTGGVMMAPPIPYGEYAKDYSGAVHGAVGHVAGKVHGLAGAIHSLCGKCGGNGLFHGKSCGDCGGDGCTGCGSDGMSAGHGHGQGSGGLFHGGLGGLFGHKKGHSDGAEYVQTLNTGHGHGMHGGSGVACVGPGCTTGYASSQAPIVPAKASAQAGMASPQGSAPCGGCGGMGKLGNGRGCGLCGGTGLLKSLLGKFCGNCRGNGCGGCGGTGLLSDGHDLGLGHGGKACGNCGGKGCGVCGHLAGLKNKAHHILGAPIGLVHKLTHKGEIEYFVGPGGPVPITPGYVPYVVTTRSPRDFFAFPPFSDQVP